LYWQNFEIHQFRNVNAILIFLGVPCESALVDVRRELGNWSVDKVKESFRHLEDASRLTTAVCDIVEFEEKIVAQYPWAVTDVIVGLMLAQATPELCVYLRSLPTWATYNAKSS
jgi:hypothetical protein